MIEIKGLTKQFKKKQVLRGLDLTLGSGVYGLLGPNGAGKTTLLRCMTDIYTDYRGKVLYEGGELANNKAMRRKIGYLPQKFDMFHELKLWEMMRYFAELKKVPRAQQAAQIEQALRLVNLYENGADKVGAMSGGMVRRAGIAQAILGDPKVVIVDEPTAGLDPEERLRFKGVIAKISGERTVLLSTHIIEDVEALCGKIVIMDGGRIRLCGTPGEIAAAAGGHVFTVQGTPAGLEHAVVKQFEKDGKLFSRILAQGNPGDWKPETATVEDGYMYVIKGCYDETVSS